MECHILGSAGYFPTRTRHTLGVFFPDHGILLDAGTGLADLRNLARTEELDVFLSHAHLDHIVGLTYLLGLAPVCGFDQITVHGAAEKLGAIRDGLFSEHFFPVVPPFRWRILRDAAPLRGGGRLTTFPLKHPGGSIGFRLDWPGHSLAYVTDTTACPACDYVERIAGVDVLLHECNFNADRSEWAVETGHSWTTAVGKTARAAGAKRLYLIHVDPLAEDPDQPLQLDEVTRHFPSAEVAHDGMVIEF